MRVLLPLAPILALACATPPIDTSTPSGGHDTAAGDTADTSKDTADTGKDSGGDTSTDTADTGKDTSADTADTGKDTSGDTADTGKDTGNPDTGDSGPVDSGDSATFDTSTPPCRNSVRKVVPRDGATDVWYEDDVEFTLLHPDATATIVTTVPGSSSTAGNVVTFTPSPALASSTTYTVSVSGCWGIESTTFTTSTYGSPVADPAALVDHAFDAQLASATWTEPANLAPLVSSYVTTDLLLGVTGEGGGTIDLRFGVVDPTTLAQDLATNTVDVVGADFSADPKFTATASDLTVSVSGAETSIYAPTVSGTFASGGDEIRQLTLTGVIDTVPLVSVIDPTGADSTICDLATAIGDTCTSCPDGSPYCLDVRLEDIAAPLIPGLAVAEVTTGSDPTCSVVSGALPLGWAGLVLLLGRRRRDRL